MGSNILGHVDYLSLFPLIILNVLAFNKGSFHITLKSVWDDCVMASFDHKSSFNRIVDR